MTSQERHRKYNHGDIFQASWKCNNKHGKL